ncbi:MAG: hypothetical protein M3P18_03460 [Actinomycetota bacterium]|nr:hypothetical protein [Actinomycetota bacterium]
MERHGDDVAEGFFSLVRWRLDATRDEARNVAVILVEPDGAYGAIRAAPLSTVSSRLKDQGILDAALVGLEQRIASGDLGLAELTQLHRDFQRSIVITEPRRVAVPDQDAALAALYRAYLAPRARGGRAPTKGAVLDRVVETLRRRGVEARRGAYIDDFIFDVVIETSSAPTVLEVLSFAADRKDWTPVERDAGHFLYALSRLSIAGRAVIEPPVNGNGATSSYERVRRWLAREHVPDIRADELIDTQLELDTR